MQNTARRPSNDRSKLNIATGWPKFVRRGQLPRRNSSATFVQHHQFRPVRGAHLAAEPALVDPFGLMRRAVRLRAAARIRGVDADDLREVHLRRPEHHAALHGPYGEVQLASCRTSVARGFAGGGRLFERRQFGRLRRQVRRRPGPLSRSIISRVQPISLPARVQRIVVLQLKEPFGLSLDFAR